MKTKPLLAVIVVLAVAVLGPGLWNGSEAQENATQKEDSKGNKVGVVDETGPAGHQTIGIDESTISGDSGEELLLRFSTLMTWDYQPEGNPPPPEKVKRLNGRTVHLTGFMYPLQEGNSIQYFCLLRTTQTCCYGPRPQYNQYVFVEMAKPTEFHRLDPISCVGTFKVEPSPQEGFIYRLEGQSCETLSKR
jgi:hypothetical protein